MYYILHHKNFLRKSRNSPIFIAIFHHHFLYKISLEREDVGDSKSNKSSSIFVQNHTPHLLLSSFLFRSWHTCMYLHCNIQHLEHKHNFLWCSCSQVCNNQQRSNLV